MMYDPWLSCVWLLWLATLLPSVDGELVLLQVLYRHGARTPIKWLPDDVNNQHWWLGHGQLTNIGKQNQYELGTFLRRRYGRFLHAQYHANYTRVVSTDIDRTLMSAAVNLAALYRPSGNQSWNDQLAWQPIPVHTRPVHEDLTLRFSDACPRFQSAARALMRSKRVRDINARYASLYAFLREHSHLPVSSIDDASSICDTLSIEQALNLTLPTWSSTRLPEYNDQPVFPTLLQPLADISFQLVGWSHQLRRLGGGQLLSVMADNMVAASSGQLQPPNRQLFMFSAHDFNVAALLSTLGVFNGLKPPLASCVMVELYRNISKLTEEFTVQIHYRNSTEHAPILLHVPGCRSATECSLSQFLAATESVRPAQSRVVFECGLSPVKSAATLLMYVSGLVMVALVVLIAAALVWRCCCCHRSQHNTRGANGEVARANHLLDYHYTSLQQDAE